MTPCRVGLGKPAARRRRRRPAGRCAGVQRAAAMPGGGLIGWEGWVSCHASCVHAAPHITEAAPRHPPHLLRVLLICVTFHPFDTIMPKSRHHFHMSSANLARLALCASAGAGVSASEARIASNACSSPPAAAPTTTTPAAARSSSMA